MLQVMAKIICKQDARCDRLAMVRYGLQRLSSRASY